MSVGLKAHEMTVRRKKKFLLLLFLLVVFLLVASAFLNYFRQKEVPIPRVTATLPEEEVPPPRFLFLFDGSPDNRLNRPVGVGIHPTTKNIYVGDAGNRRVAVFSPQGNYLFSFNKVGKKDGTLKVPLYITFDKNGDVYVSDRRLQGVFVFSPRGTFKRRIVLNGDEKFTYLPLAMDFDEKGNLYVGDILTEHRILVIDSSDRLVNIFGKAGMALKKGEKAGMIAYPNGLVVEGDKLYISDSDNRRIQVFSLQGKYLYMINTGGIPRGLGLGYKNRLHIVDVVGHNVMIYSRKGKELTNFGELGTDLGQFYFPNGISTDGRRVFVVDTGNNRVEVWTWGLEIPVPKRVAAGINWFRYAFPPVLLGLYLWVRRRRYVADEYFLERVVDENSVKWFRDRFRKVMVLKDDYDRFQYFEQEGTSLKTAMRVTKYNRDLAARIQHEYKIKPQMAGVVSAAKARMTRAWILSDNNRTRQVADELGLRTLNFNEAVAIFQRKKPSLSATIKSSPPAAAEISEERCKAATQSGERCRNKARPGSDYCGVHQKLEKRE
jgi:sugar lactone lactonase YvrE